jgi:formate C-acetyltransferase
MRTFEEFSELDSATKASIAFERFLASKKILLRKEDILAGYAYKYSWNTSIPQRIPPTFEPDAKQKYDLCGIIDELKNCREFFHWAENSEDYTKMHLFERGVKNHIFKHNPGGHIVPGFERVLNSGLSALVDEAGAELGRSRPESEVKYIEAMLRATRAVSKYILRYAGAAVACSEQGDTTPEEREHLRSIAVACNNVAERKPSNFFEAVQLLWLLHEALIIEQPPSSMSLGRLDIYLSPFYESDLAKGHINYDQAAELIDALWIKFSASEFSFQNVTLGGVDENGAYIVTPVTYMALQASRKFRYDQPLISLRYSRNLPRELWDESIALLLTGTGFPAFFNDEACVKAKERLGLSRRDAQNFAIVGCVEMTGSGNDYSNTESMRLNIPILLELMLNGGVQRLTGENFPIHPPLDLECFDRFEDFYNWFQDELREYLTLGIFCADKTEIAWSRYYPTPFLSFVMSDCVRKGLAATAGGTIYSNSVINGGGFANAANSLVAIKKVVFDDKLLSLSELNEALNRNFEGFETLHKMVTRNCPKFGNDDDTVDAFVRDIVAIFYEVAENSKNGRGGKYGVGLYTVTDHSDMGEFTGALPDGRFERAALANGFSPAQGTDLDSPAAVVNSVIKANPQNAANGMVLDLKFTPSFLQQKSHQEALRHLINSYFARGGIEVQFNVIGRETLLEAQAYPEKHKNLVVRVSGFSAYFHSMSVTTQDEIIARTEYARV